MPFDISTIFIFMMVILGILFLFSGVLRDILFKTGVSKADDRVFATNVDNIKFELEQCSRDEADFTKFIYKVKATDIKLHVERKTDIVPVLFFKGKLTPSNPEVVEKEKVGTGNMPPLKFNVASNQLPADAEFYTIFFFEKSDRCLQTIRNQVSKPEDVVRSCASSFLPGKIEKEGPNCKGAGTALKSLKLLKAETKGKSCDIQIRVFNNDIKDWIARDGYYLFVKNCMEKAPLGTYSGFPFVLDALIVQSKFFDDQTIVKKDGHIGCDINPKTKTADLYKNCVFDLSKLTCLNFDPKDPSAKNNPVQLLESLDFECSP